MKIIIALLLLSTLTSAKHHCAHDDQDVDLHFVDDGTSEVFNRENRVLALTYESIRIHVDYTYLTVGKSVIREYIRNQLVASAIKYYQDTLKVVRSNLPLVFDSKCGGLTPPSYLSTQGVSADLVIMVTAQKSTESYLAYAVPCALSQTNDRPVFGMINFNLALLETSDNVDLEENLITTIHEMAHVLGFSNSLYEYFRDPTTQIRTNPKKTKLVNGRTVTYLDIPDLTQRIRNHFGCTPPLNPIDGAYLENEGAAGSAGSHFERRLFHNEFMTASSITDSVISEFTLALLEGTGWYKPEYDNAEPFSWGKNRGCDFVTGSCMSGTTPNFVNEFCDTLESEGCTYTARAVAVCGTPSAKTTSSSLPSSMNYWGNYTVVLDSFSDNCPYYLGYPNLDCENPSDKNYGVLNEEVYGTSSRCFTGTLGKNAPNRRTGYCFPSVCTSTGTNTFSLKFTVGSQTVTCTAAGPQTVLGFSGQINCPDPTDFCLKANPVYCERGCSGRGTCLNGVCQCPTGWGGSDCAFRLYVDSCSRCAVETEKKSCFGDSCACNPASGICTGDMLIGVGDGGRNKDDESDDASRVKAMSYFIGFTMLAMLFF